MVGRRRGQPKMEQSQIHLVSVGAEGKERASIITVSARREAPQAAPSLLGGQHRARAEGGGGGGEEEEKPLGEGPEKALTAPGSGGGGGGIGVEKGGLLKMCSLKLTTEELLRLHVTLSSSSSLTTIDLTDSSIGDEGARLVASACKQHACITALGLSGNLIGDNGAEALATMLRANRRVQSLFLRSNSIGPAGIAHLSKALGPDGNATLTKLNLKNNQVGAGGAAELGSMLVHNRSLLDLNLCSNALGPDGASALAAALSGEGGAALSDLDLGCNELGPKGASHLAQVLPSNRRLERLNLRWNNIGDGGMEALIQGGLEKNQTLKELQLFGNGLSAEATQKMQTLKEAMPNLKVLK